MAGWPPDSLTLEGEEDIVTMPPAGWYPDPASDENIRFWDGQAWTDRVQPKAAPPPPTAPAAAVPPPVVPPTQPWDAAYGYGPGSGPQLADPYGGYGYAQAPGVPSAGAIPGRIGPDGQVLAGWWRRVGGYLIDGLVVGIPAAIASAIAVSIIAAGGGAVFDQAAWDRFVAMVEDGVTPTNADLFEILAPGFWTVLIVSGVVWFIASMINGVYLVSRSGQTLGDRAVNVRKVMAGRTVPTLGIALGRWLIPNVLFAGIGNLVPFGFVLYYGNYLWPLWDAKSRTLHDMMVKTYVERADLVGPPVSRP